MPKTTTRKVRKIGDEWFLPLDEEILAYLLARADNGQRLTLKDGRVVVTNTKSE